MKDRVSPFALAALILMSLLAGGSAFAAVVDPPHCTLGSNLPVAKRPFISLEGKTSAGQPDNCSDGNCADYTVIVRDFINNPLAGEPVMIDFGSCCDMQISCDQLNAATGQTFVGPAKIFGTTNASGQFTFKPQGASRR